MNVVNYGMCIEWSITMKNGVLMYCLLLVIGMGVLSLNPPKAYAASPNCAAAPAPGVDLSGCDFTGADLRSWVITGADLRGAKLSGTDFRGANLMDVNISGATVSNTTNFYGTTMDNIKSIPTPKHITPSVIPCRLRWQP